MVCLAVGPVRTRPPPISRNGSPRLTIASATAFRSSSGTTRFEMVSRQKALACSAKSPVLSASRIARIFSGDISTMSSPQTTHRFSRIAARAGLLPRPGPAPPRRHRSNVCRYNRTPLKPFVLHPTSRFASSSTMTRSSLIARELVPGKAKHE